MASDEHTELIVKAILWLSSKGYVNITKEFRIPEAIGNNRKNGSYVVDVIGFTTLGEDAKTIAVECGGTQTSKLEDLLERGVFSAVYILPYGANEPYKYKKGMNICRYCGHSIGEL